MALKTDYSFKVNTDFSADYPPQHTTSQMNTYPYSTQTSSHRGHSRFLDRALERLDKLSSKELKTVIRRLANEHEFFEILFNTIDDGVVITDSSAQILQANQAAIHLLGIPEERESDHEILPYLPDLNWQDLMLAASGRSGIFQRQELEIYYPIRRFIRLEIARLPETGEGEERIAMVLHDTTETRKKTEEAVESERVAALTLLAASVAHEIGNPLSALSIHLQLMKRELRKMETALNTPSGSAGKDSTLKEVLQEISPFIAKLDSYLKISHGEINRLDYITTQFLQAMRPTPPKLTLAHLNDTIRDVIALLEPEIENRGMFLELDLLNDLAVAPFDVQQIKQVLVNLIKNALQVMPNGGKLTLRTRQNVHWIWVSIIDTGKGMSPEQIKNLFTPFFTTRKNGSGLGLMIVQRIIRAHQGRIEIESQEGHGTEFRIFLPLTKPEPRMLAQKGANTSSC